MKKIFLLVILFPLVMSCAKSNKYYQLDNEIKLYVKDESNEDLLNPDSDFSFSIVSEDIEIESYGNNGNGSSPSKKLDFTYEYMAPTSFFIRKQDDGRFAMSVFISPHFVNSNLIINWNNGLPADTISGKIILENDVIKCKEYYLNGSLIGQGKERVIEIKKTFVN
ncbi:hypothetical protein ACFRAE_13945 [Sphingobacterium sp. HJSM2_6]|uniref:hypothetical protein n=1 Tax=Sphingobacterium sp. HJSM2_6 TaxID=3366264 RepID=UPI003BC62833